MTDNQFLVEQYDGPAFWAIVVISLIVLAYFKKNGNDKQSYNGA